MYFRLIALISVFAIVSACVNPKTKETPPAKATDAAASTDDAPKTDAKTSPDGTTHPEAEKKEVVKKPTHWTYSGLTGPEMWGDLRSEYSMCKSGKMQSPIDLVWHRPTAKKEISFDYQNSNYQIIDNGHTIQAVFEPGNKAKLHGEDFELVQLHFHSQSEHALSGKHFPMEAHFVHKNAQGKLAVVAIFFEQGKVNPYLEGMWQQIPKEKDRKVASTTRFNPVHLFPEAKTHYSYDGSLTTPPCSEGVDWFVFNTPQELSNEQLNHFKVMYSNNFRPLQSLNERKVVNY